MDEILDQDLFEDENPKKGERSFITFIIVQIIGSVIGVIISWIEIESIVGSGPILSLIGMGTFVFALIHRNKMGALIGISPLIISIFWFAFISLSNWSPSDAYRPVNTFLSIALVLTIIASISIIQNKLRN